jgi:hypothetical protein
MRTASSCGVDEWCGRNSRSANRPSRPTIDIVLRQQFLHHGAGGRAARVLVVTLDQPDRVWLDLVGIELEKQLCALGHLLAELGADPSVGHYEATLTSCACAKLAASEQARRQGPIASSSYSSLGRKAAGGV